MGGSCRGKTVAVLRESVEWAVGEGGGERPEQFRVNVDAVLRVGGAVMATRYGKT